MRASRRQRIVWVVGVVAVLLAADAVAVTGAAALPLRKREVNPSGAWSWFGDPRAVHHRGAHRRTYVGWVDARGNVQVASYDHDTRVRAVATLKANFQIDDHNNPSLLVRPDGHLMAFWSAHIGGALYYRRTARPEDVTAWEPERRVGTNTAGPWGYTYPNPVQLSAEGHRIWLFWRGGNFNPTFSTSGDGLAWTPARTLVSVPGQRPYLKVASNGRDTIDFAFTQGHPRNVASAIYFARYRAGSLRRASGAVIEPVGSLPIVPSQAERIYDPARHHGAKAWVHDVASDSRGRPVVVYATFPAPGDHRYNYDRWDGQRWVHHEIARAGGSMSADPTEPNYSGGITLDHEDPSVAYLARNVGGSFRVELWRTRDGGHSWTSRVVRSGSVRGSYRPVSPRGQTGADANVVWMLGGYPSYSTFRTGVAGEVLSHDVHAPAAVAPALGRLDVFASEGTGGLIHKRYGGTWTVWGDFGRGPAGHRVGAPTVASWDPGRLDAFAVDQVTGRLLQRTFVNGTWSGWVDRGLGPRGHPVASPAAASWGPGRIDVVARDVVTGDLVHWSYAGGWRGPARVGPGPGGAFVPSVASWAPGRLDVFAVATGGTLAHTYFTGRWSRWELLGKGPGGAPYAAPASVTAWGPRRLDVFAPADGGRMLAHRWFDGFGAAAWRGPENLGTGPDRAPIRGMAAVSWAPRRIDLFFTDAPVHGMLHTWYAGGWRGPEHLDFGGSQVPVMADAAPRATPIPLSPLARSLKED
jgi:hypothetical protein